VSPDSFAGEICNGGKPSLPRIADVRDQAGGNAIHQVADGRSWHCAAHRRFVTSADSAMPRQRTKRRTCITRNSSACLTEIPGASSHPIGCRPVTDLHAQSAQSVQHATVSSDCSRSRTSAPPSDKAASNNNTIGDALGASKRTVPVAQTSREVSSRNFVLSHAMRSE